MHVALNVSLAGRLNLFIKKGFSICKTTTSSFFIMIMSTAMENAKLLHFAMDKARGWDACKDVVADGATFACQCDTFKDMKTIKEYVDWCQGFGTAICPNSTFDIHTTAWDEETKTVTTVCTFHATHTGTGGGPQPPTNKSADTDYVYLIQMNEDHQIVHLTKIWNDTWALKQLGWM